MTRASRLLAALLLALALAAQTAPEKRALPYRLLLVISNQWKDPASQIIDSGGEFQMLASLLKTWGVPFDILRLDQQRFDPYYLLDREGLPRYGTIVWDAGPADPADIDTTFLETLVRENGVGLVVLGDAAGRKEVGRLAGLRYESDFISPDDVRVTGDHFLIRELPGREGEFLPSNRYLPGVKVIAGEATVLARRGALPFLTIREWEGGGRVAWLGIHRQSAQIEKQFVRDLFKRCLVWAQGYALYAEYPKSIILFMDDMGTSDKAYLSYWHYRTPSEDDIRRGLIEPLKRHNAVLVENVNTGYVDRETQRILSPWKQDHVLDRIDGKTVHDYASTKRGLDAGLREGVFEIQSHGWTHMLPDLDSPPGPFWTAPMDGVGSLNWYTEFGDRLRNQEVPAVAQRFHMERAIEYIKGDFGVTPLFINPGGGGFSSSYANSSMRIAAQLGFGLAKPGGPAYLGRDFSVAMTPIVLSGGWAYDQRLTAGDVPWTIDGPYFLTFHDRDVALDIDSVGRLLAGLGDGVRYMSANEYCAYLHAQVERTETDALAIAYDPHYGRYFENHPSKWTLHLSDETRRAIGGQTAEKRTIEIPKGIGRHVVSLRN